MYLVGGTVRDLLLGRASRRRLSTSRPTRARLRSSGCSTGWADAVWTQGERFGTIGARKGDAVVRDHDPPRRGLPPRLAQARGRVRRRDRGRPVAPRLHRERDGARAARAACSSIRSTAPLTWPRAACARRCRRRSRSRDDPLRMLRAARFIAGYELAARSTALDRRGPRPARPARDRVGRAHPRRARQAADGRATRARASGSSSTPGCADEFLPELLGDAARAGSDPPSQGRARSHDRRRRERDSSRAGDSFRIVRLAALLPRRRQAEDPIVRAAAWCRSTTTRWSARA